MSEPSRGSEGVTLMKGEYNFRKGKRGVQECAFLRRDIEHTAHPFPTGNGSDPWAKPRQYQAKPLVPS